MTMWFLWAKLLAFILLAATFIYLRSASAVLRSLLPKSLTAEMGLPLIATLFVTPSILLGFGLYLAHVQAGVIWISVTAIYFSWIQDLLYVSGIVYYYFVLRRIRKRPASFDLLICLEEYAAWPSTDVVRRPFDYLLPRLPFARRWKKTKVLVRPIDFHRFLNDDLRLIDEAELALVGLTYLEFCAVPHFLLPPQEPAAAARSNFGEWREEPSDAEQMSPPPASRRQTRGRYPLRMEKETSATRYYIVNRALHAELTEELWATSRKLCQTLPSAIARTWKTFHFQESVRLRFVALFDTSDLIQRLICSVVLCTLRDEGVLVNGTLGGQEFRIPASTLHWTDMLELAFTAHGKRLERLSRILLEPRENYEEWQEGLSPFGAVLGGSILFPPNSRNVLAGWRMLGILRNKIIGHGGVGTHLRLRPLLYLSAVHYFFLTMMREITDLDLGVFAGNGEGGAQKKLLKDQGLGTALNVSGNHHAFACPEHQHAMVSLHPYFRYHDGRLLIINRLTKEGVNYIDYNVANIFEPSYLTLKTERDDFIRPLTL